MAAKRQRKIEIGQKIQNHIPHAWFTGDRESPGVQTPKQDGASTQSKRFENVGSAANASVKQDGHASIHFAHYGGKSLERRDGAVDLAAAVIRDNHSVNTGVESMTGVLGMQDSLQNNRKGRVPAKKRNVAPGERRIGKEAAPKLNRRGRILLRRLCEKCAKYWIAEVVAKTLPEDERQVSMLQIAFPPSQHARVERDHQRLTSRALGTLQHAGRQVGIFPPIELEPSDAAPRAISCSCDLFDRTARGRAERERQAKRRSSTRRCDLSVLVKNGLNTHRSKYHRRRQLRAEEFDA